MAGSAYIIDEGGVVSAVKLPNAGAPKMKPISAPLSNHLPYDESVVYEDLTEMRKIHLASLLFNVEHRFLSEKVYSYIGNMLLAVNPYRNLTMPIPGVRDMCAYYDAPVRAYYARLRGETRQQVGLFFTNFLVHKRCRFLSSFIPHFSLHFCHTSLFIPASFLFSFLPARCGKVSARSCFAAAEHIRILIDDLEVLTKGGRVSERTSSSWPIWPTGH